MAAKSGAEHVFGCDTSQLMVTLACDVVATNGMQDKVSLLHALSSDLSIPKDIPKRLMGGVVGGVT